MIYLIWGVRFKYQISTIWGLPPQLINHNKPAFVSPGLTLAWVSKNGIIAFCSRKHGYYKMDLARKNAKLWLCQPKWEMSRAKTLVCLQINIPSLIIINCPSIDMSGCNWIGMTSHRKMLTQTDHQTLGCLLKKSVMG